MSEVNGSLDDKSVLLVVEFHKLGNTRKVSTSKITVDADKSMLHVNKNLLDSREYDAIKTHDGKTRQWLYTRALPSLFKEGVFRVPNSLVVEIDEYLAVRATERLTLVEAFKANYRMRVMEALTRLNGLANPHDYYTADEAASRFSLTWRYLSFATPDSLKNLQEGLFEREKQKLADLVREANEEIKTVLRVQLDAIVKRMVTQLSPGKDGKKRKIYDSLIGNCEDFFSTFSARNLADDTQLQALVTKARQTLHGVDADLLREDGMSIVKDSVRDNFGEISKALDAMIVDKPARRFDFGE